MGFVACGAALCREGGDEVADGEVGGEEEGEEGDEGEKCLDEGESGTAFFAWAWTRPGANKTDNQKVKMNFRVGTWESPMKVTPRTLS